MTAQKESERAGRCGPQRFFDLLSFTMCYFVAYFCCLAERDFVSFTKLDARSDWIGKSHNCYFGSDRLTRYLGPLPGER